MNEIVWQLPNVWMGIGITVAVFCLYYGVAFYSRSGTHTTADLYVAGRSIGPVVNSLPPPPHG
ncbi:MAG: hypothetical protein MH219_05815 [Marinobacter sp.]|nr:hypothetical protein [Marinobacter sp.]